ncbi:hypothetical protein PFFCH_03819 [Plasmodium falciparum FCH/4]|uniref:Uncharacterized protein n=1 Tax=Plasmodium falciparum FCH/4 TaxID=1036724 RepID=A0A024VKF5_PLAFA|nr:hypothetical protein PFFCH_03819 [Plasmodium falciparum FCH/4]
MAFNANKFPRVVCPFRHKHDIMKWHTTRMFNKKNILPTFILKKN